MVNKKNLIIVVTICCIFALFLFYPTEKRKIKRLLKNTANWAQKNKDDSALALAVKSKKSKNFFADRVLLKIQKRDLKREVSLEDIERGFLFLMNSTTFFKIKISDIDVELKSDFYAEAVSTVIIEAKGGTLEEFSNVNEVVFGFSKKEEGWRIDKIEVIEVLEK